ncbi:hypothetical protein [Embleya sp. NPDC059259]
MIIRRFEATRPVATQEVGLTPNLSLFLMPVDAYRHGAGPAPR